MAELSTGTYLTTDPFFSLLANVQDVKTKVADSVFENYKLQVAQSNDINNRAMQVALHDATALSDLKAATAKGTLETMLAAQRTDGAVAANAAITQREVFKQGEFTRNLVNDLNTQNLNTALINTNVAFDGMNSQYAGLGLAYGGAVGAYQSANSVSALNAVNSSATGQRFVNTGVSTGTVQATTSTQIGG